MREVEGGGAEGQPTGDHQPNRCQTVPVDGRTVVLAECGWTAEEDRYQDEQDYVSVMT